MQRPTQRGLGQPCSTRARMLAGAALTVAVLTPSPAAAVDGDIAAGVDLGFMRSTAVHPVPVGTASALPILSPFFGFRAGLFVVGARLAGAHDFFFGRSEAFVAGFAGLRVPVGTFFLQATGEGGRHWLMDVGSRLHNFVNAETGSLPYLGGHLQLGRAIRPLDGRWSLALGAFGRWDLRRQEISSRPRQDCFALCAGTETATFEVGGETFGLTVSIELRRRE